VTALLRRLRESLTPVLVTGSWQDIRAAHDRVGLTWREDLNPGFGKPRYVERVLAEIPDDEIAALARRCLDAFPGLAEPTVQDALWWYEAEGERRVSVITRRAIVDAFDGHALHADHDPAALLHRFARPVGEGIATYVYLTDGRLGRREDHDGLLSMLGERHKPPPLPTTYHALFDDFGYQDWPDPRFFRVVEALVHPTARKGEEQRAWVDRINADLVHDGFELREVERLSSYPVYRVRPIQAGGRGRPKNIIFASTGPKPELGFSDALDNDVVILNHAEHCLVFDEPLGDEGLCWSTLARWWGRRVGDAENLEEARKSLGTRLLASVGSPPEKELFAHYFRYLALRMGERLPALLPQVYLHYDPATRTQLRERGVEDRFLDQRMDFLLLLPHHVRVVLEVDGQQHYATDTSPEARPSPKAYTNTVRSDRELRLAGYEVYRFSGYELDKSRAEKTMQTFLDALLARHRLA
jgi:very-short-patch-repair endonuclease